MKHKYEVVRSKHIKKELLHAPIEVLDTLPKSVDLRPLCPPVYDQGQLGSCHDDKTEVLTIDGWKLFKNITKEDFLASVDPVSKNTIFEHPINIINKNYDGDMYYISHQSLDCAVTSDHKMLVSTWNQKNRKLNNEFVFKEAKDLGWYSGLINRIKYEGIDNKDTYILKGVDHKRKEYRVDKEISMKYWMRLLGFYLAEGTMIKNDENHYKIQLACYKEREKSFIKDVLDNLNQNYCELEYKITFENKQIYKAFEEYNLLGVKAPYKFVPKFVFKLSSENISEFIEGYFNGDGTLNKNNRMFYTSSKQIAKDLQTLIILSGKWATISTRPPRKSSMSDGRIVQGKYDENCIIEWTNKNLSIDRKKHVEVRKYKGKVYCAEVPTYHTLITRRNDKILISGNCTANAGCAANSMKLVRPDLMFSRLYLYYKERQKEGTINEDSGAQIEDICIALHDFGVCLEKEDPYDPENFNKTPDPEDDVEAAQYKIDSYAALTDLNHIKAYLASTKMPVLMGMDVYESFESDAVASNGKVPMPKFNEQSLGGHAVLIVGYQDTLMLSKLEQSCIFKKIIGLFKKKKKIANNSGYLIVRNSWGSDWGDNGYFYLPYEYINKNLAYDFWTIK